MDQLTKRMNRRMDQLTKRTNTDEWTDGPNDLRGLAGGRRRTLRSGGFALGYFSSAAFGFKEADRRTVSIEVGMQNSALGVVLATAHFADPLVAGYQGGVGRPGRRPSIHRHGHGMNP